MNYKPNEMIRLLEIEHKEHPIVYSSDRRIKQLLLDASNMIGFLQQELTEAQIRISQYRKSEEFADEEFKSEQADKECALAECEKLKSIIFRALVDYSQINFRYDGDCGVDKIFERLDKFVPDQHDSDMIVPNGINYLHL